MKPDLGVHLPCDGLERRGGGRAPFTSIAFMVEEAIGVNLVVVPRARQRVQCGCGRLGRLKAFGLQMKELLLDGLRFALLRFIDGSLGALPSGLRRHYQPPLGHAVVA